MTTATIELYKALKEAGVPEEQAEAAAKSVLSREEAKETLVTKVEFYKGLFLHATTTVTVTVTIIGVLIAVL